MLHRKLSHFDVCHTQCPNISSLIIDPIIFTRGHFGFWILKFRPCSFKRFDRALCPKPLRLNLLLVQACFSKLNVLRTKNFIKVIYLNCRGKVALNCAREIWRRRFLSTNKRFACRASLKLRFFAVFWLFSTSKKTIKATMKNISVLKISFSMR